MQPAWIVLCLVLWLAAGVVFWRLTPSLRRWLEDVPRSRRAVGGAGLLLASLAVLAVLLPAFEGARQEWQRGLAVAGIGLVFVSLQSLAAAFLLSLAETGVTKRPGSPSIEQNSEGNHS